MASDDLKLQLLIQAVLDSKGFDEAKTKIAALEAESAAAATEVEAVGAATMTLDAALIGVTAGLSILLPLLVQWFQSSRDVTDNQKELTRQIDEQVKALAPWMDRLKGTNAELDAMAEKLLKVALRQQIKEMEDAGVEVNRLKEQLVQLNKGVEVAPGRFFMSDLQQQRIRDTNDLLTVAETKFNLLRDAQLKHTTVELMLNEARREGAAELKKKDEIEGDDINLANRQADTLNKRLDKIKADREKERARQRKEQEQDVENDKKIAAAKDKQQLQQAINDKRLTDAEIRNAQARAAAKVEEQVITSSAIGQGFAAMSSLFGRNKALAIAGAIADTYAAANRAFYMAGGYPWGIAPMVASILQGLANVKAIEQSSPGFDDPMNDMIAERLGRKSASDFVRLFGGGFHSGLMGANGGGGGSTSNTTINRGVTVQSLHMSGILGVNETDVIKHLNRKLIAVQRLEGRTSLGR